MRRSKLRRRAAAKAQGAPCCYRPSGTTGVAAQQAGKVHRIGWLSGNSPGPATTAAGDVLRAGGYVVGQNVIIEGRWAEGKPERLTELATELVDLKVELILAYMSTAAKRHTRPRGRSRSSWFRWAIRWGSGWLRV